MFQNINTVQYEKRKFPSKHIYKHSVTCIFEITVLGDCCLRIFPGLNRHENKFFVHCSCLSLLGGYVRRQAPGTEKKTALKVQPDNIFQWQAKCFFHTSDSSLSI